jgi:hypothetical protein
VSKQYTAGTWTWATLLYLVELSAVEKSVDSGIETASAEREAMTERPGA